MLIRFWGVRGTVPWATPASIGVGCNTPCVEVRDDSTGAYLVLDAGSGLVGLSGTFTGEPRPTPLLLSHYHWDHTQGLPFFGPLYAPGWAPEIYAPDLAGLPDTSNQLIEVVRSHPNSSRTRRLKTRSWSAVRSSLAPLP